MSYLKWWWCSIDLQTKWKWFWCSLVLVSGRTVKFVRSQAERPSKSSRKPILKPFSKLRQKPLGGTSIRPPKPHLERGLKASSSLEEQQWIKNCILWNDSISISQLSELSNNNMNDSLTDSHVLHVENYNKIVY